MARHRHLGHAFGGHDPGVCAYAVRANALQLAGDRERAQDSLMQGLALAESLDHPNTLAHALHNLGISLQLAGDRDAAFRAADASRDKRRSYLPERP